MPAAATKRFAPPRSEAEPITALDAIRYCMRHFSARTAGAFVRASILIASDTSATRAARLDRLQRAVAHTSESIQRRRALDAKTHRLVLTNLCSAGRLSMHLVADRQVAGEPLVAPADWADMGRE